MGMRVLACLWLVGSHLSKSSGTLLHGGDVGAAVDPRRRKGKCDGLLFYPECHLTASVRLCF